MPEVFIGVFFLVHVMDESDDAPQFLVCAILPGEMTHDGIDCQGVRNEACFFLGVCKDRPCFFAGGFIGHVVTRLPD